MGRGAGGWPRCRGMGGAGSELKAVVKGGGVSGARGYKFRLFLEPEKAFKSIKGA